VLKKISFIDPARGRCRVEKIRPVVQRILLKKNNQLRHETRCRIQRWTGSRRHSTYVGVGSHAVSRLCRAEMAPRLFSERFCSAESRSSLFVYYVSASLLTLKIYRRKSLRRDRSMTRSLFRTIGFHAQVLDATSRSFLATAACPPVISPSLVFPGELGDERGGGAPIAASMSAVTCGKINIKYVQVNQNNNLISSETSVSLRESAER